MNPGFRKPPAAASGMMNRGSPSTRPVDELMSSRSGLGKPLPQFEEVAIRASPETLSFGLVFRIDMSAGSGVS